MHSLCSLEIVIAFRPLLFFSFLDINNTFPPHLSMHVDKRVVRKGKWEFV